MINIFLPRLISTPVLNSLPKAIINVVVEQLPPRLPILTFICIRSACKMWVQNKLTNVNHFENSLHNGIKKISCLLKILLFWEKENAFLGKHEHVFVRNTVSSWTATGQVISSWTATGQVLDTWTAWILIFIYQMWHDSGAHGSVLQNDV